MTKDGTALLLDGKPFRYVGVNAYGMNGNETGSPYTQAQIDSLFATLPRNTVTRTWAWKERGSQSLEPIIRSAEKHHQLLILSLSEGAGFSKAGKLDAAWFEDGYKEDLLPWVDEVVTKYQNSPAIAMWEVMNEPGNKEGTKGPVDDGVMFDFIDTVASRVKHLDPNHLVETGTMDSRQYGMGKWLEINQSENIDVMSIHDYADEYENGALVSQHFTANLPTMKKVQKPIIIGEMGVRGADANCVRSRRERVDIVRQKFDAYFKDGASGINLWNWTPTYNDQCATGANLGNNDPLMEFLRTYKPPPAPSPGN